MVRDLIESKFVALNRFQNSGCEPFATTTSHVHVTVTPCACVSCFVTHESALVEADITFLLPMGAILSANGDLNMLPARLSSRDALAWLYHCQGGGCRRSPQGSGRFSRPRVLLQGPRLFQRRPTIVRQGDMIISVPLDEPKHRPVSRCHRGKRPFMQEGRWQSS